MLLLRDPFSFSKAGSPWVAHEWLSECIVAFVYRWTGWIGIVYMTVVLFVLTVTWILRFLLDRMASIYALLFTALAYASMATHMLVRPHVLAWPITVAWVGALLGASEKRAPPPLWALLLMPLWANLHGSYTLGLAIACPIALEAVLDSDLAQRRGVALRWGGFVVLACLAAMATPFGWRGLWLTLQLSRLELLNGIAEWRPPEFISLGITEIWILLLIGLAAIGYVRLPSIRLVAVLGLLHQALAHARYLSIFGMLAPMLIAASFGAGCRQRSRSAPQAAGLDALFEQVAMPAKPVAMAVAAFITVSLGWLGALLHPHLVPDRAPVNALSTALAAGAAGPVLNSYESGGYLIFCGVPVFIDGRADLYGDKQLRLYSELMSGNPAVLRKTLEDYRIGWTLLAPTSPATAYLDNQHTWKRIYADDLAVVHMRVTAMPSSSGGDTARRASQKPCGIPAEARTQLIDTK
jgi:hypothetical protein